MSLRPYIAASALFGAFLFNVFLCGFEDVGAYAPKTMEALKADASLNKIALADVQWVEGDRLRNLKTFGLQTAEIESITKKIKNNAAEPAAMQKFMDDNLEKASKVFCTKATQTDVSPVYKATSLLLLENAPNTPRDVIPLGDVLAEWAEQPWYKAAPVDQVYKKLETSKGGRDSSATVYGIGSLLASEEGKAIKEGASVFVSYDRFLSDHKDISIRNRLIDYFAEFLPLAETANAGKGICGKTSAEDEKPKEDDGNK
jgi:hypothetical protein